MYCRPTRGCRGEHEVRDPGLGNAGTRRPRCSMLRRASHFVPGDAIRRRWPGPSPPHVIPHRDAVNGEGDTIRPPGKAIVDHAEVRGRRSAIPRGGSEVAYTISGSWAAQRGVRCLTGRRSRRHAPRKASTGGLPRGARRMTPDLDRAPRPDEPSGHQGGTVGQRLSTLRPASPTSRTSSQSGCVSLAQPPGARYDAPEDPARPHRTTAPTVPHPRLYRA
jgi:hypothetical protein